MVRAMTIGVMVGFAASCGPMPAKPPGPGEPCASGDAPFCASQQVRLICEKGVWTELRCDAPYTSANGAPTTGQCIEGDAKRCVLHVPTVGDTCPAALEFRFARCLSASAVARCAGGRWVSCTTDPVGSRPGCEEYEPRLGDGLELSFSQGPNWNCGPI